MGSSYLDVLKVPPRGNRVTGARGEDVPDEAYETRDLQGCEITRTKSICCD